MIAQPLYLILIPVLLMSCKQNHNASPKEREKAFVAQVSSAWHRTYNYDDPDQIIVLAHQLKEISSLAYDDNRHVLLTNEDETGQYYQLDLVDGKIKETHRFAKSGDYEAIEIIDNQIVVAKSSGTLFFHNTETGETEKRKNQLKSYNDIEGLCLDNNREVLLLACKGQPISMKRGEKNVKCIYQYDLNTSTLDTVPVISIHDDQLTMFLDSSASKGSKAYLRKLHNRAKQFSPSGIAIHPDSGDIYIISAKGSTIVITDYKETIKEIGFFNEDILPQPEGITFDNNGNMYIAGEGKVGSGKIFMFEPRPL